ncbi:MAG: hypothetical protein BroJett006_08120 [Betaproteobacteria bacterium]|nr:MAG: hypothetical protein BroJett006_08120 [Betaproteobacteria bacterium]
MANSRLDKAFELLDAGNYHEASRVLKLLALKKPADIEILYLIGVAESGMGDHAKAGACFDRVLARAPSHEGAIYNKARLLNMLHRHRDALAFLELAIGTIPANPWLYLIRGNSQAALGSFGAAIADFDKASSLNPELAEAHANKGNALRALGRPEDSLDCYLRAVGIRPDYAEAWFNRGAALAELGRHEEALASYDQAVRFKPDHAEAWLNRGLALSCLQRHAEALACFYKHLVLRPDSIQGRQLYAERISEMRFETIAPAAYSTVAAALSEAWTSPSRLSRVACNLLLLSPAVNRLTDPVTGAFMFDALNGDGDRPDRLGADPLLHALLTTTPVCDDRLEDFLTAARRHLLDSALKPGEAGGGPAANLAFYGALARQCFINEYVFFCEDGELQAAARLRDLLAAALGNAQEIAPLSILAVAAYFPLCSIKGSGALLDRAWPDEVMPVLIQQVREPLEELRLKSSIPQLTPIDDAVSMEVRRQYEENPYPRWVRAPREAAPESIGAYLRDKFPGVAIEPLGNERKPDILIAGCGTGQHPVLTAQLFAGVNLLAIDLSAASLGYARRKTEEMGIRSIEYAQADILKLGLLGRSFDVIESIGVLHHLEKPLEGWRLLVSLLRPNGFMHVAFYSELADRDIVRARRLIAEKGYGTSAADIRRARRMLREADRADSLGSAVRMADFYSLSECRDLLFHVQEQRMTLDAIREFIAGNGLSFLGFDADMSIAQAYKSRFPDDPAATNLANWQQFESGNPDTFVGMYRFWLQKRERSAAG